jgi:hypothetical protein
MSDKYALGQCWRKHGHHHRIIDDTAGVLTLMAGDQTEVTMHRSQLDAEFTHIPGRSVIPKAAKERVKTLKATRTDLPKGDL